ncbi:MAG: hypothetical protein BWY76_02893 [bacterium ADurb.Bin429]|nr:MAG: hypothetical protein BWY76_02893 [bacterium ADurb.Bin429]
MRSAVYALLRRSRSPVMLLMVPNTSKFEPVPALVM